MIKYGFKVTLTSKVFQFPHQRMERNTVFYLKNAIIKSADGVSGFMESYSLYAVVKYVQEGVIREPRLTLMQVYLYVPNLSEVAACLEMKNDEYDISEYNYDPEMRTISIGRSDFTVNIDQGRISSKQTRLEDYIRLLQVLGDCGAKI